MRGLVCPVGAAVLLSLLGLLSDCEAAPREQVIPILGTAHGREPQGSVAYIHLTFEERGDHHGLQIRFHDKPGKFSRMAQTSAEQAIVRTARSLGLSTDSWTVDLRIPHEGVTLFGDSLSAMVGLTVAAMAQGKTVPAGYVLTGTVTAEGDIGPVGSIPLKVQAARAAQLRRVLVPNQPSPEEPADSVEPTRFTTQVSPVRSVPEAYEALTDSSAPR
ncbi:S16 family serine protease [Nitrospira moscoviensis]|nr:S16 family serine protease [Nitrospira moscoviensis]